MKQYEIKNGTIGGLRMKQTVESTSSFNCRDLSIDFIKGILVIGVIYGHVITAMKCGESFNAAPHVIIRIFDMPLFAFLSGIFLSDTIKKYNLLMCFQKKVCSILYPLLLWNCIWDISNSVLKRSELGFSFDYYWFLWALFKSSIIICLCGVIYEKNRIVGSVGFICSIIATHIGVFTKFHVGFVLVPCIVGFMFKKKVFPFSILCKKMVMVILAILFFVGVLFWNGSVTIWELGCNILKTENYYMNALKMIYRGLMGISGAILFMVVAKHFYSMLSKYSIFEAILVWLITLGQRSLKIYLLQALAVELIGGLFVQKLASLLGENILTANRIFMIYILAPLCSLIYAYVINKVQETITRLPLVGKYMFSLTI